MTLLIAVLFTGAAGTGMIGAQAQAEYENRLFDQSRVHTIDIVMQDWEAFLDTCTSEEYSSCDLVIDGESYKNVAIRGKGNTSLSSVSSYGNDRYSFKVEFDHYQSGMSYYGLDKLSLNNVIQDNTYMKDYFAYTLMNKMGVASPLCSFVQISVNGEPWGLYLAVEGIEDAFLQRNYGRDYGELYKPDSMSFGGGRGNGRDFDMGEMAERFGFSFGTEDSENADMNGIPQMPTDGQMPDMGSMPQIPTGGWMGDMGSMPQMPTGGWMGDMSSMPQMPTDGQMPDMGSMPQMPTDGQTGDMSSMPQMPTGDMSTEESQSDRKNRNPQTFADGFGGGGGFGSSADVRLQYTDDDPSSYSNIFDNAKTDITKTDQDRLIASLKRLGEGDTSAVDREAVIRYMAVHNFLCNDDSYTGMMVHNYYLYEEDGVLSMIPWDYNLAYGGFNGGQADSVVNRSITSLVSSGSDDDRPMAGWITASEEYTEQYLAVYAEFIETVFDSGWFASEIDRVTAMIDPYVKNDPTAFCTYDEFQKGVQTLKSFCLKRAQSVSNQLNGDNTPVDASKLNLSDMGTMNNGRGGRNEQAFPNAAPSQDGRQRTPTGSETNNRFSMPAGGFESFGGRMPSVQSTQSNGDGTQIPFPSENMRNEAIQNGNASLTAQNADSDEWPQLIFCMVLLGAALTAAGVFQSKR